MVLISQVFVLMRLARLGTLPFGPSSAEDRVHLRSSLYGELVLSLASCHED
jgi:hypothetical protein